ncbi:MAG: aromatic amino acid lyase, partial [Candidatus Delongbacteria bacterium]
MKEYTINGKNLDLAVFSDIIYNKVNVRICKASKERIIRCREIVGSIIEKNDVRYGINTGFGKFSNVMIDKKDTVELQKNIVLSHATGTGRPLDRSIVKGMMLLKLNSFLQGFSGVRCIVAETLNKMINSDIIPFVPEKGSVGASGDLAPLA